MTYSWDNAQFPVAAAFDRICAALEKNSRLLLSAETGAGKSTFVPIHLLDLPLFAEKTIVMLEPRRLAARMLADFLASTLGEKTGGTVGFAVRGEKRASERTRLLIVTEGVLTRMMQNDMELSGVALVIFDEFHERHLTGDLGLAMALDIQENLRPDLKIMVMSATLEPEKLSGFLDGAEHISVSGRSFPLRFFYDTTPGFVRPAVMPGTAENIVASTLRQLRRAAAENPGCGILCFLPGAREIAAVHRALEEFAPPATRIFELCGAMSTPEQDLAVRASGPKIILATNVAESSVTVENISVVVDSLYEKRVEFDPSGFMDELVLRRISKRSAVQRAGRAGRTAPGKVYRCCREAEFSVLPDDPVPEILRCDLANTVLDLICWGKEDLSFPDPPPHASVAAAKELLRELGAIDGDARPTALGRKLDALPLNVRLGAMLLFGISSGAGADACELCAVLSERDFLPQVASADISLRLEALRRGRAPKSVAELCRELKKYLPRREERKKEIPPGILLASGCPDRIARQRSRHSTEYLLSGGRGAALSPGDDLIRHEFLVVPSVSGGGKNAAIRLAAPVDEAGIRDFFSGRITRENAVEAEEQKGIFFAVELEKFGSLVLKKVRRSDPEAVGQALLEYLKKRDFADLKLSRGTESLKKRMEYAGFAIDWSELLAPCLAGKKSVDEVHSLDLCAVLRNSLSRADALKLEKLCPPALKLPCGRSVEIDYGSETPSVAVRIQDLYGFAGHPVFGPERRPLRVELLSPARRPVQITGDLPGFWRGSWAQVRKEMKSRYPKHDWPEDPAAGK